MNRITKEDVRSRYKKYNRMYFDNRLGKCKFSVQKQWSFGTYTYKREKNGTTTGHIWIATNVDWTEEALREVIIHEMIHHYVKTIDMRFAGLFGHGWPFIKQCRRLKRDYGLKVTVYSPIYHIGEKRPTGLWRIVKRLLCFYIYL